MRRFWVALLLTASVISAAEDRFDRMAAVIMKHVNASDGEGLDKQFNAAMANALPPAQANQFLKGLLAQFGKIVEIGKNSRPSPAAALYRLKMERGELDMDFMLDDADKIASIRFVPAAASPDTPAKQNETELSFPLKGKWLIFWGGDTPETGGHHLQAPGQRFAFDIVGAGADGKRAKGDGTKNEDYYAFGREVLAPADGTVTDVIQGVRDNRPGALNPYSAVGNAILIEHRPGEVSLLAHLKFGSILVKPGETVKRGQVLALCGNSGNSSEPHLHYHLQSSASLGEAVGVRVRFASLGILKEGKTETRQNYSPVKGDMISE